MGEIVLDDEIEEAIILRSLFVGAKISMFLIIYRYAPSKLDVCGHINSLARKKFRKGSFVVAGHFCTSDLNIDEEFGGNIRCLKFDKKG
jgi:hypothetical protein